MPLNPGLIAAYRMTRDRLARKGYDNSPARCLAMARADLERVGHDRFTYYRSGDASYQNKPNDRGGRWIERPDLAGLRFVDWCDNLVRSIDHKGWFQHPGGDPSDVYRAAVYQLPARNGRPLYVEGYVSGEDTRAGFRETSTNGTDESRMAAVIFLNATHLGLRKGGDTDGDACRSAAMGADREAELAAERERDYQESYALGQQAADAVEEAKEERESARELMAELRDLAALPPAVCGELRRSIGQKLRHARRLYAKAAKLWEEHGEPVSWRPDLADAFAEAAGAASYWESRK